MSATPRGPMCIFCSNLGRLLIAICCGAFSICIRFYKFCRGYGIYAATFYAIAGDIELRESILKILVKCGYSN